MMWSFNSEVAKMVGTNAAVVFQSIGLWIDKKKDINQGYHDGRYWVYCSRQEWLQWYDFLTEKSLRTALTKLVQAGLILTGCYNKLSHDRTTWYALSDLGEKLFKASTEEPSAQKGQSIGPKGPMEQPVGANQYTLNTPLNINSKKINAHARETEPKPEVHPIREQIERENQMWIQNMQQKHNLSYEQVLDLVSERIEYMELTGKEVRRQDVMAMCHYRATEYKKEIDERTRLAHIKEQDFIKRKTAFWNEIIEANGGNDDTATRFYAYYGPTSAVDGLMKFELDPLWDTKQRLTIWKTRQKT